MSTEQKSYFDSSGDIDPIAVNGERNFELVELSPKEHPDTLIALLELTSKKRREDGNISLYDTAAGIDHLLTVVYKRYNYTGEQLREKIEELKAFSASYDSLVLDILQQDGHIPDSLSSEGAIAVARKEGSRLYNTYYGTPEADKLRESHRGKAKRAIAKRTMGESAVGQTVMNRAEEQRREDVLKRHNDVLRRYGLDD